MKRIFMTYIFIIEFFIVSIVFHLNDKINKLLSKA